MLTQDGYAMDLLVKFNMAMCKSCRFSTLSRSKLKIDQGYDLEGPTQFRMLVESLQYLTITKPDLTYKVNQVSQFMQNLDLPI